MDVKVRHAEFPAGSGNYEPATEVIFDNTPQDIRMRDALLSTLEGPSVIGFVKADAQYAKEGGVMLRGVVQYNRIVHLSIMRMVNIEVSEDYL